MRWRSTFAALLILALSAAVCSSPSQGGAGGPGGFRPAQIPRYWPKPCPQPIQGHGFDHIKADRIRAAQVRIDAARLIQSRPHQVFQLLSLERHLIAETERQQLARLAFTEMARLVRANDIPPALHADLILAAAQADFDPAMQKELQALAHLVCQRLLLSTLIEVTDAARNKNWKEAAKRAHGRTGGIVGHDGKPDAKSQDELLTQTLTEFAALANTATRFSNLSELMVRAEQRWNPQKKKLPNWIEADRSEDLPLLSSDTARQALGLRGLLKVRQGLISGTYAHPAESLLTACTEFGKSVEKDLGHDMQKTLDLVRQDLSAVAMLHGQSAASRLLRPPNGDSEYSRLLAREIRNLTFGDGEVTTLPAINWLRHVPGQPERRSPPAHFARLLTRAEYQAWRCPKVAAGTIELPHHQRMLALGNELHALAVKSLSRELLEPEKTGQSIVDRLVQLRDQASRREEEQQQTLTAIGKLVGRMLTPAEEGSALILMAKKKSNAEIVTALKRQRAPGDIRTARQFCEQVAVLLGRPLSDDERTRAEAAFTEKKHAADVAEEFDHP